MGRRRPAPQKSVGAALHAKGENDMSQVGILLHEDDTNSHPVGLGRHMRGYYLVPKPHCCSVGIKIIW